MSQIVRKYNSSGKSWALITGGSMGIGKSIANLLAKEGFNIFIISNEEEANFRAELDLKKINPKILTESRCIDLCD